MKIIKDKKYIQKLLNIIDYIAKDKPTSAFKFQKELDKNIKRLATNPYLCRKSNYFNDENYRDLIYKGYTIIYKIESDRVLILDIFKWQNR